jgi:hypothetical protein
VTAERRQGYHFARAGKVLVGRRSSVNGKGRAAKSKKRKSKRKIKIRKKIRSKIKSKSRTGDRPARASPSQP